MTLITAPPAASTAIAVGSGGRERIALGLGLSALSALLATLSFGPANVWWLVFIAFVPMIVAPQWVLPARWSGAAFAIGIAGYVTGYMYGLLDPSFAWWMRLIPLVLAVPLFWWGRADRAFHDTTGHRWFLIVTQLVWTAGDFARSGLPMVPSRASLAYAVFEHPALIQPVSITGIAGLQLVILLVNWAVAAAIQPGTKAGDQAEFDRNVEQTRVAAAAGAQLVVCARRFWPTTPRRTTAARSSKHLRATQASTSRLVTASTRPPDNATRRP